MPDEQGMIQRFFKPLLRASAQKITDSFLDDGALLPDLPEGQEWAVSTDQIIEGIHFFGNEKAEDIAFKLLAVNLSDMAAMGANPFGFFLQLALHKEITEEWLQQFSLGLDEIIKNYDVDILGGDLSSLMQGKVLSATIMGSLPKGGTPRRSQAKKGDCLAVTGTIGDAALGLAYLKGQLDFLTAEQKDFLIKRYQRPTPRIRAGIAARGLIHAAIDVSDGVLGDAQKLCNASKLACHINAATLPLSPTTRDILERNPELLLTLLSGGDDYELMIALPEKNLALLEKAVEPLPLTKIGYMMEGNQVTLNDQGGKPIALSPGHTLGFSHF